MCQEAYERIGLEIVDAMGKGGSMGTMYRGISVGLSVAVLCMYPAFAEDVVGCDDVNWTRQIMLQFEGIEEACQEVVVRDGKRYARFEVKFHHATADHDMYVLMKLQDGTKVERVFPAPEDFHVLSSSGKTDFSVHELSRGEVLDVYIPLSLVVAAAPSE